MMMPDGVGGVGGVGGGGDVCHVTDMSINDGLYTGPGKMQQPGNNFVSHGEGVIIYDNGTKCSGSFVDGHGDGLVVIQYTSGTEYVGNWQKCIIHGRGKLTDTVGNTYDGEWRDGKCHGHGTYTKKAVFTYVGAFICDKYHGHGVQTWTSGRKCIYEGEFENGLFHGQGVLVRTGRAGIVYEGVFLADSHHGFGVEVYTNGDTYSGDWLMGNKHGRGKYYEKPVAGLVTLTYDGMFFADVKQGVGCMQWSDGRWYTGDWLQDVRHGNGVYSNTLNSLGMTSPQSSAWLGDKYSGSWEHDKMNGPGMAVLRCQDDFKGFFYHDRPRCGIFTKRSIYAHKEFQIPINLKVTYDADCDRMFFNPRWLTQETIGFGISDAEIDTLLVPMMQACKEALTSQNGARQLAIANMVVIDFTDEDEFS